MPRRALLKGPLRVKRLTGVGLDTSSLNQLSQWGIRWGARTFYLFDSSLVQQKDEDGSQTELQLKDVSRVRWATPQESKQNGFATALTNSVKMLLGNVPGFLEGNAPAPDHQTRFVMELVSDSMDSVPSVIFEADSPQEAAKWMQALQERVMAFKEEDGGKDLYEPVMLVKEAAGGRNISELYDLGSSLGCGMSGVVKRIVRKNDGKAFAMKTIMLSQLSPKQLLALRNEIDILKILDHPHICKLYETYTEPGHCVRLVLELCEGGELFDRLHARKRFSEQWVAKLVYRMAGVLRYLHQNRIAHRDLKLENWLFRSKEDDDEIVLIDFGLSHKYRPEEHMHKKVGTSYYVAPEVLKGDYMGVQSDMWSLGVIVYMLLGGCAPYDGADDEEILANVAASKKPNVETGHWRKISDAAKHFVLGLLTVDPDRRLTAENALQHPWVVCQERATVKAEVDEDIYENLVKFTGFSTLKRIAMEAVAFSLSHDEIKKLTDVFETLDHDSDGYITFGGMKKEFDKKFKIPDAQLRKIFDALDEEHTGKIHVNEFIAATMTYKYHLDERHLRLAFQTMDHSNTGFITVSDLKSLLGRHVDDARALEMIKAAELEDHGENHRLSFNEFLTFVRKDGETQMENRTSSSPPKRT